MVLNDRVDRSHGVRSNSGRGPIPASRTLASPIDQPRQPNPSLSGPSLLLPVLLCRRPADPNTPARTHMPQPSQVKSTLSHPLIYQRTRTRHPQQHVGLEVVAHNREEAWPRRHRPLLLCDLSVGRGYFSNDTSQRHHRRLRRLLGGRPVGIELDRKSASTVDR